MDTRQTGRRALATLGAGPHAELLEITRPARAAFAERHGMEVVEEHQVLRPDRPTSWSKITMLRRLFSDGYTDVMWIDADATFVDATADLDQATRGRSGHLWVCHHLIAGTTVPNAGVMYLVGSRWTTRLLARIENSSSFIHHKWWDNAALLAELGYGTDEPVTPPRRERHRRNARQLPGQWNAIPQASLDGSPVVVHLPGYSHAVRLGALATLAAAPQRALEVLAAPHEFA